MKEVSKVIAKENASIAINLTILGLNSIVAITLRKFVNFSVKRKSELDYLERGNEVVTKAFFILLTSFFVISVLAQEPERPLRGADQELKPPAPLDTIPGDARIIAPDTTDLPSADTVALDSAAQEPPKGDIETTIKYSARDSINFKMNGRIIYLYGDAKIDYGNIKMEAEEIVIDYTNSTIKAYGKEDSLGRSIGDPIFKEGEQTYETKDMIYNFKTKKARITRVVTTQGDGFLHGQRVYKNEKDEMFSYDNTYTTCNLEHPHFRIRSTRTKAIPKDKIISGPFNLELNDVPLPLGFPFALFPSKQESSSGIIFPSYGDERLRGFFLRGAGYYFDFNDYIKTAVTGDIYSKGSYGLNLMTNYKKRYAFNGNFSFNFTSLKISENIEDDARSQDFRINWSHSPESKGNSRFSATVNAATSSFNQNNVMGNIQDQINAKLSSTVSYSKTFAGTPFNMALNGRFNQDVRTREVDLLLPEFSLNMQNLYPFRGKTSIEPIEKITIRYSVNGTQRLTNNIGRFGDATMDSIAPFSFENMPIFLDQARRGFRHQIPLQTSMRVLKHFTMTTSANYQERWYFEQLNWRFDPETNRAVSDTTSGFRRVYDYSFSAGLNTWIYGTQFFRKGKIEAIRHAINPSLSFSYSPDFSDSKYDYYDQVENPNTGNVEFRSKFQGFAFGAPPPGRQGNIGLSVNNTLEMKVRKETDSATVSEKVPILNNFGFSTSYNVVADSFKLGNITFRANTSVFKKKVNINFNGAIDPYTYILDSTSVNAAGTETFHQRRVDQFAWNTGNGLGNLSRISLALSSNFNPKARDGEDETRNRIIRSNLTDAEKDFLLANPHTYVDFTIPWSLSVGYNFSYTQQGFREPNITQALTLNGDLSLSEKWKVRFGSGYDIQNQQFTQSNLGISRDLHCWEMNFDWVPFGRFTSYNFTIRVKSAMLQDLKLNRTRSFFDTAF